MLGELANQMTVEKLTGEKCMTQTRKSTLWGVAHVTAKVKGLYTSLIRGGEY